MSTAQIGVNGGHLVYRFAPGNVCEIVEIEVSGEHRRTGVGRNMVSTLCKLCRQNNIVGVYAITRTSNRIAQKFYESLGFSVSVLRNFYDPRCNSVDALLYSRSAEGPV